MIRFTVRDERLNFNTTGEQVRGGKGDAGVSVSDAVIDATGHLILTLSDGTVIDAGVAKGNTGDPGVSPTVSVTQITDGFTVNIVDVTGSHSFTLYDGADGDDGDDGVSPTVTTEQITGGYTVTITDATGNHTFSLYNGTDGEPGQDGDDGVSPSVTVTSITGGHTLTITDADGDHSFNVMDGVDGQAGVGIPSGGTSGQVLKKQSSTDYDVAWESGGSSSPDWTDITNTPTTLSGYGITDGYSVPSGGIPDTDLSSGVQTSLGLADSAIQTETDPTVPSWAKASTKPSYNFSEIGNTPTTLSGYGITDALASSHASDSSAHSSLFSAKVDVAQGVAHAGEFLVVGNNGNVTTASLSVWEGGSY